MDVILYDDSYRNHWQEFISHHKDATFYHRIEWKGIIEKSFGHNAYYLMAYDQSNLVGVLPMIHIKSRIFGSIICSMPFLNFGGVCANNQEAMASLINKAEEFVYNENADYLEMRHLESSGLNLPTKFEKVSMTIELNGDPEEVWNSYKSKHRTNIRRAAKNDLKIVRGKSELLEEFFNIISIGWRNLGTPIYRITFFEDIIDALEDSIDIYIVYYEGKPVATAFNGCHGSTVEGMWTYSLEKSKKLQTNYFLYWEIIKDVCTRGFKEFHLGRSTNHTGATFYKKKWNATVKQLYWEYVLNNNKLTKIPELNVQNPKYKHAINLWKKLPVAVSQYIGPFISKNIP